MREAVQHGEGTGKGKENKGGGQAGPDISPSSWPWGIETTVLLVSCASFCFVA